MKYFFNEARSHTKQQHCKVRELMRHVSLSVKGDAEGATGYWCKGKSTAWCQRLLNHWGGSAHRRTSLTGALISYEKIKTER